MRFRAPALSFSAILLLSGVLAVSAGLFDHSPVSLVPPADIAATNEAAKLDAVRPPAETTPAEQLAVPRHDSSSVVIPDATTGSVGPFVSLDPERSEITGAVGSTDVASADEPATSLPSRPPVELPRLRPDPPPDDAAPDTLDIMIGQMIMVGFKGTQPGDPWPTKLVGQIGAGKVGGVLFLERNAANYEAVRALNQAFMGAGETPVFLAIDQEGGNIERLTRRVGFPELPSARDVAKTNSVAKAGELYAGLAKGLRDWKFNLNLGPVVDVDVNPRNPIIGGLGRSFSEDPAKVTAYGSAFIKAHHANRVLTAVKHFPGHGSSRDDSHKGFVDVSRTWTRAELEPYRRLISAGLVDMVMTGHLYVESLSAKGSKLPASLSPNAVKLLRNDLGFQGVVISDDMEMKAIEAHYSVEDAAIAAVRAGTNILVYSNYANPRPDLPDTIIAVLKREALADPQFLGLIKSSYRKIMKLKAKLGNADSGKRASVAGVPASLPATETPEAFVRKSPFIVPNLN